MPPAARKFHIHCERRLCSAISPRLAMNTRLRLPVLAKNASPASRSFSKAWPRRCGVNARTAGFAIVAEKREDRDARQLDAPGGDTLGARLRNTLDVVLQAARRQRGDDAAFGLDVLEERPRSLGEI